MTAVLPVCTLCVQRLQTDLWVGAEGYALDCDEEWLEATCIKIDRTHWEVYMCRIHYTGWGSKYVLQRGSSHIPVDMLLIPPAPFLYAWLLQIKGAGIITSMRCVCVCVYVCVCVGVCMCLCVCHFYVSFLFSVCDPL